VTTALPDEIEISGSGAIRVVTLNRPDKLNAANAAMHTGLARLWGELADDPDLRVVILTGAGRAFSAGGDVDWFDEIATDPAVRERVVLKEGREIVMNMIDFPLPIIAAVNGAAVGLGCSLAGLCDIVLMSDRAFFADPHVSVGLVAADGGSVVWPLLMSILHAKEYLFTGARIGPDDAIRLGMANRIVPGESLLDEAHVLAEQIAAQSLPALKGTKRAVNMHLRRAAQGVLEFALAAESETFLTPEHRERIAAMGVK
jgi:enoyl-CoA hydratase